MEAQHKWNQSSGSRLKQNSEKDLAPTPVLSLFHCSYCCSSQYCKEFIILLLFSRTPFPLPLLLLGLYFMTLVIWPIFLTVTIHGMVTLILNSIMIHSIIMLILLDTFALSMVHAPLLSHL